MKLRRIILVGLVPLVLAAAPTAVRDPETELADAKTELDNLSRRLEASKQMTSRLGLGPQNASAEKSWTNAQNFYEHKEWLSTIRELNNYLNQTQVPVIKPYLKAQYMLGRSYEEMAYKAKGLRAYFRYLAAFLTAKEQDHNELLDVLRRMIPLAASDAAAGNQLNELLASVVSLELPKEVQPAVYYYAAKAAANSGNTTIATSWLEKTVAGPADPGLRARALYMRALVSLAKKDYDGAKEALSEVIQADKDGSTRDLARLALARISIHERKRETALKYYALIEDGSASFKDALFESLYVHLDLQQDAEARGKAVLYVARYPEGPESLQLKMLLAYLDMRAGDLPEATKSLTAADDGLKEVNQWIEANLRGKAKVSQTTLQDFVALSGGQVPATPTVKDAYQIFARLAEIARHLADIRGEIRNVTFTIGRANLEHLKPFWVNRAEQLAGLGDDVLKVGHRLIAAERNLYADRLDGIDKQKLAASENRRTKLLTAAADAHRKLPYMASYGKYIDLNQSVATTYDRLRKSEAELTAARYLLMNTKNQKELTVRQARVAELEVKTKQVAETIQRTVEVLRASRVEDLLAQSPHRSARKFLSQYALALHDEADTVAKARDEAKNTAQRLNAEDGAQAWKQWEFLAADVFGQIDGLDREVATGLKATLNELDQEEKRYDELQNKLHELTGTLESQLGKSLASILDQYEQAIDLRFARHQKWRADIDWLSYQGKLDEERKLNDKFTLEQQILKDNLTDLQQGVLWQWPQ